MKTETEDGIFCFVNYNLHFGRKELSKEIRKCFGEEEFRTVQEYWKKGFLCVNRYGYVYLTWKGCQYWKSLVEAKQK